MSKSLRRSAVFAVLIALVSIGASAQTVTGTMNGTVTDKSGGALPGVTVTIRNSETGLERVTTTNEKGFYNAPFLPVGFTPLLPRPAGPSVTGVDQADFLVFRVQHADPPRLVRQREGTHHLGPEHRLLAGQGAAQHAVWTAKEAHPRRMHRAIRTGQ